MIAIKSPTKFREILLEALKATWFEFAERTTIHGLRYIIDEQGTKFTRTLWLIVTIVGFIASNVLVDTFWLRYKENPTRLKIESFHKPLNRLELPAITICQVDVDDERAAKFIDKLLIVCGLYGLNKILISNRYIRFSRILPDNVSKSDVLKYMAYGSAFTNKLTYNVDELNILQNILDDNKISTSEALESIHQPCNDLLFRCRFQYEIHPCMELFEESMSYLGKCCTFNGKNIILRTQYFQRQGGLSIVMKPTHNSSYPAMYSKGVKLLVHQSIVFPSDLSVVKILSHQSENIIRIKTDVTKCSADVKALTYDERDCIFPREKNLRFFQNYAEENCDVECRMIQILRLCGCLPYNYRVNANIQYPICNFMKIACLVSNYFEIHESRMYQKETCNCPPDCNSVSFDASMGKLPLKLFNYTVDTFYEGLNNSHMIAHISFGKQVFKKLRRDLLINIIVLASGLGGIYSLFIGMGVLTFFEIFYFLTFRLRVHYLRIRKHRDLFPTKGRKIFVKEFKGNVPIRKLMLQRVNLK